MIKQAHMPTPWHWGNQEGYGPNALLATDNTPVMAIDLSWSPEEGEGLDSVSLEISDEDAAFIVRACNAHEALVEALDVCKDLLVLSDERGNYNKSEIKAFASANAALKLAKGD